MQHRVLHDIKKRSRSSLSAQLHVDRAMRDIQYLRCAASSSDPLRRQSDHHHHPIAIPVCGTRVVAQKHLAIISVVEVAQALQLIWLAYHFGSRCCRTPITICIRGHPPQKIDSHLRPAGRTLFIVPRPHCPIVALSIVPLSIAAWSIVPV